jgi:hypothetical protein
MSYAFKPADADWIEISEAGSLLPGGGEMGEDVVISHAFVESLASENRVSRGFVEVAETEAPEVWTGWTIEDVDGVPTRAWQVPA